MKTSKNYRLSDWALNNLDNLKCHNPSMNDTQIIEYALSLAALVDRNWNDSSLLIAYGAHELDNDHHAYVLGTVIRDY